MFRLVNSLFSQRLPTKSLQAFVISPARVICPAHIIILDFTTTLVLVWILTENFCNTGKCLTLEGPCIIFAIYTQSNEIHNVVALIKFLLVLRCQLYMFRTVTVHPQELLVDTVCADCGTW